MVVTTKTDLDEILTLSETMLEDNFEGDERVFLETIHRNALLLKQEDVFNLNMVLLSAKSHDLRQPLTAVVGYSALLNSPKLADHANLTASQLKNIYTLHDLSRRLHWRLDSMIMFASHIARPEPETAKDTGMLNMRGYLIAQADHYVCKKHIKEMSVPMKIPFVYANDSRTKLMLRGLFAAAIDMGENSEILLNAYTMMRFVRVKLSVLGEAEQVPDILKLLKIEEIKTDLSNSTQAMISTLSNMQSTSVIELGMYVATTLAHKQGGRMKVEADGNNLTLTLTMPTGPVFPV